MIILWVLVVILVIILIYMIISALFMAVIIVLESGPVYIIFMADIGKREISPGQWALIACAFILVIAITAFTIYKPLKMGVDALKNYE